MSGEEMHEKLIDRLTPSERKKWMGKIWGTKMRPQGNREEKVVILGWYENRQIPFQLTRIPSKPFQIYGRELCGECFLTNDRAFYETGENFQNCHFNTLTSGCGNYQQRATSHLPKS